MTLLVDSFGNLQDVETELFMSGMDRGSPKRTPVRRARAAAPGTPEAVGGGLFPNAERDEGDIQWPFTPQTQQKGWTPVWPRRVPPQRI